MSTNSYGKDVAMQGIARVIGGLLSFFAIFFFTYVFNEGELGEYNLILATVNIVTSITTLWLSQSVLRYYDDQKELGNIIVLCLLCSMICFAVYTGYCVVANTRLSFSVYFYIFVLVLYNVFDAVYRRSRKLLSYVLLELIHAIGRIFPMIVIAIYTHDYNSIFLSQGIVVSLFFAVEAIRNRDVLVANNYKLNIDLLRQYLHFGLPLVGLSISNWFLTTSDRYVIKFLGDIEQVGIYSTNYSLANSIYLMFALILVNAMHPIIMRKWEDDKKGAMIIVSNTLNQYLMLMLPLVFYGCLKSDILLSLFKGDSYSSHYGVFVWTALGVFVHGISLLCHKYYECIQKTNQILLVNIIAAIFNIVANFILIPIIGFEAAAFTTFLSYVLYTIIIRVRTHNKFVIKIDIKNLCVEIVALALFFAVDRFLNFDSLFSFFIEGFLFVIYVLIVYQIFKVFNSIELIGKKFGGKSHS